jgi:glycosyltransferase involved in cell wall biosynthesis
VRKLGELPGVLVTGRVPSVAAYLAHAQVAVAPLRIARGIQNKVLEAMAMAMPIVVSSGALTGIRARPGEHLILAETPREWAEACFELVRNPEEARRLGQAARKLVLDEYTWEAQFARLDRLLR